MGIKKHFWLFLQTAGFETMDRIQEWPIFTLNVLGTIARIVFTVMFFQILYGQTTSIAGWELPQTYILLGTWFAIDSIAWASWTRGFQSRIPRMIRDGSLDRLLVQPVSLKCFISYRFIDLIFTTPSLVLGIGLVIWGFQTSSGPIHVLSYLFFFLLGLWLHFSFSVLLASINFYSILQSSMYIRTSLLQLGQYPIDVYHGMIKLVFSIVLPFAFMFSLPASVAVSGASWSLFVTAFIVALFFHAVSSFVWQQGLSHYESAKG